MSFTLIEQCPTRLQRSELAVPGSNRRFIEKATSSAADVVFIDLEDAVAPSEKERARRNAIEALNELDWGDRTISMRINGLDTPYMYRDVVDVLEQAVDRLDLLMIPKVGTAADIYGLDMLVSQIEQAKGYTKRIGFELLVETALGMQNIHQIAAASRRNESIVFGSGDYAASTRARTTHIGAPHPDYRVLGGADEHGRRSTSQGDMWHYALGRLVVAARANGLRPIDGPFGNLADAEGYRVAAESAAALGCEGKMVIHPNQIGDANEIFSPTEPETAHARRVIEAMRAAQREGRAAVTLDGRFIDIASIRQAEVVVRRADAVAARQGP